VFFIFVHVTSFIWTTPKMFYFFVLHVYYASDYNFIENFIIFSDQ